MIADCLPCKTYLRRRVGVLAPEIERLADERRPVTPFAILDRYMGSVHDRHLSGLPILPDDEPEPTPARRSRLCSCLAGSFPWQDERHYEGDPGCIHEGSL